MKKVIEFPQDRSLLKQLTKSTDELIELHEAMEKGYKLLQTLEDQIEEKEAWYNSTLLKYVRAVGVENVPVGLLEYASEHLSIDVATGEIRYEPPEET